MRHAVQLAPAICPLRPGTEGRGSGSYPQWRRDAPKELALQNNSSGASTNGRTHRHLRLLFETCFAPTIVWRVALETRAGTRVGLRTKRPLLSSDVNQNWNVVTNFIKTLQNQI
jgi:hypothetical protein